MCDLETLTADERALLSMYRALPSEDKPLVLALLPGLKHAALTSRTGVSINSSTILNNKIVVTSDVQKGDDNGVV